MNQLSPAERVLFDACQAKCEPCVKKGDCKLELKIAGDKQNNSHPESNLSIDKKA